MKKSKAIKQHRQSRNIIVVVLGLSVVGTLYLTIRNKQPTVESFKPAEPQGTKGANPSPTVPPVASKTPPYHESGEAAKPFPPLLPAAYFRETPLVARAYQLASEIPEVLAQQPCYCYCDRYGHKSLLDCYASDHGAGCLICIKEVLLASQMTMQSKTPAGIREAIIGGAWRDVSLDSPLQ